MAGKLSDIAKNLVFHVCENSASDQKSQKIYLRDSGILHTLLGNSQK